MNKRYWCSGCKTFEDIPTCELFEKSEIKRLTKVEGNDMIDESKLFECEECDGVGHFPCEWCDPDCEFCEECLGFGDIDCGMCEGGGVVDYTTRG
jgi:hypothetical protein